MHSLSIKLHYSPDSAWVKLARSLAEERSLVWSSILEAWGGDPTDGRFSQSLQVRDGAALYPVSFASIVYYYYVCVYIIYIYILTPCNFVRMCTCVCIYIIYHIFCRRLRTARARQRCRPFRGYRRSQWIRPTCTSTATLLSR